MLPPLPAVPQTPLLQVKSSEQSFSVLHEAPAQWPSHEQVPVLPPPPLLPQKSGPVPQKPNCEQQKPVAQTKPVEPPQDPSGEVCRVNKLLWGIAMAVEARQRARTVVSD